MDHLAPVADEPNVRSSRLKASLAGLTALLVAASLVGSAIFQFAAGSRRSEQMQALETASTVRARIEGALNQKLALGTAMAAFVKHKPDLSLAEFTGFARELVGGDGAIRNLSLLKGTTIIYAFPLKGNESAIGRDLALVPAQSATVRRAIETGKPIFAGPVELVQGGRGIITRIPVFLDSPAGDRRYWGQASLVLNIDRILDGAASDSALALDCALKGLNGDAGAGGIFWGDPTVLQRQPLSLTVTFPGGTWLMYAAPRPGWAGLQGPVVWLSLVGAVFVILVGWQTGSVVFTRSALRTQAFHDYLTGLPNRALFEDRFAQVANRADRAGEPAALFIFDLDGFKQINDRHGHQTGDRLLALVAQRINQGLRRTDTVARIGGDEFAVIAPLSAGSGPSILEARIRACFAAPFDLGSASLGVGMSLGYACFPEDGRSLEELYRTADERMYRTKPQTD